MHKLIVAAIVGSLVLLGPTLARGPVEPVLVGGDADFDACGAQGQVSGLDPNGDNFLAVREGPGTSYGKLDELHTGDVVNLCDEFEGWYGIVYGRGDCGVGTPIPDRNPYAGPCASGWVSMRYITPTAG
jgi:hypothetical protein